MVRVVCSSPDPGAAHAAAFAVRAAIDEAGGAGADAQLLGPAPLFRLRGRERSQLVIKGPDRYAAITAVGDAVAAVAKGRKHKDANLSVDVDPQ